MPCAAEETVAERDGMGWQVCRLRQGMHTLKGRYFTRFISYFIQQVCIKVRLYYMKYLLAVLLAVGAFSMVPTTQAKADLVVVLGNGHGHHHHHKPYWKKKYYGGCYGGHYYNKPWKKKHYHCW